jgi:hypothetical protein
LGDVLMDFGPTYHPSKYLLDTIRSVVKGEVTEVDPHDGEEIEEHKGTKPHKHPHEDMDPVNPKAVKKKFKDRKDKDLDNDGDVDGSDKYLHKLSLKKVLRITKIILPTVSISVQRMSCTKSGVMVSA